MNKKSLIISALSLGAVILIAGFISNASAQVNTNNSEFKAENRYNRSFMKQGGVLSEEQKLEMETRRLERQAEARLHREKMEEAINSGSYEAWAAIVSENMGADFFLLEKVNADNFAEFVAHYNSREMNREGMRQGKGANHDNCPFTANVTK